MSSQSFKRRLSSLKQKSFLLIGNLLVVYILVNEMVFSPIYPDTQIQSARDQAATLAQQGQLDEAEQRLKSILKLVPKNQSVWIDYLVVLSWNNKHELALTKISEVLLDEAPHYFFKAMLDSALHTGQLELAQTLYQQQSNPSLNQGLVLLEAINPSQDPSHPLAIWLKQKFPDFSLIGYPQVASLEKSSSKEATVAVLPAERLIVEPLNKEKYLALETQTTEQGHQQNQTSLTNEIKPKSTTRAIEHQAKTHRLEGELRKAQRLYEEGLLRSPNNPQLTIGLALVLAEQDQFARAKSLLSTQTQHTPNLTQLWDAWIYVYQLQQDVDAELKMLAKLIQINPKEHLITQWVERQLSRQPVIGDQAVVQAVKDLHQAVPDSSTLLFNYLALLEQQNQCAESLAYLNRLLNHNAVPAYVYKAQLRCARQLKRYDTARVLAKRAKQHHPQHRDEFLVFEALINIDDHQPDIALNQLSAVRKKNKDYYYAKAYAHEHQGHTMQSAFVYHTITSKWPEDQQAFVKWCLHLSDAGGAITALTNAQARWEAFSLSEQTKLNHNATANVIRDASRGHTDPNQAQMKNQKALERVNQNLTWLLTHYPENSPFVTAARFDQVLAYQQVQLFPQAIRAYQNLLKEGMAPPNYVKNSIAEAFLYQKDPKQAEQLARAVIDRQPTDHGAQSVLYYALLEQERFQEAANQTEVISDLQPIWRVSNNNKIWRDNPKKLAADRIETMHLAFNSNLNKAQLSLENQLTKAPANTDLRNDLATVYRYRGWPEAADYELSLIQQTEPNLLSARVNQALVMHDLRDYQSMESSVSELARQYPHQTAVKELNQEWLRHNAIAFRSELVFEEGDNALFSGNETTWTNQVLTAPLQYRYRLIAQSEYREGKFADKTRALILGDYPAIASSVHFQSLGLEYRWLKNEGAVSVSNIISNESQQGFHLFQKHQYNDYVQFGYDYKVNGPEVPLAADYRGVTLDSLALFFNFRFHEGRTLDFQLKKAAFSASDLMFDDALRPIQIKENDRYEANIRHFHRIYQNAHHIVSLSESLSWMDNQETDSTLYYSPDQLLGFRIGLHYDGVIHRHYHQVFKQHLSLSLGPVSQKNALLIDGSTDTPIKLESQLYYEHRWEWEKTFSLYYGASLSRAVYDGQSELTPGLRMGIAGRLL